MSTGDKQLICIVSQSHLCRNPRVLKEAVALAEAGYKVHILTAIYSAELLKEDKELISDLPIKYTFYSELQKTGLRTQRDRVVRRLATAVQEKLDVQSKHSLGYAADRLKRECKNINAGLYIMHQELPTVIGSELLEDGYKVAFDVEDWYSEDLLPEARAKRPLGLLKKAEAIALNKGVYITTTSHSLAEKMAEAYGGKTSVVVYNAFPVNHISNEKQFDKPLRLFWFSQTVGPGRGLEQFVELLHKIAIPLELHLLGNVDGSYRDELARSMPQQHRLVFHGLVSNAELPAKIAGFDIGLALELTSPPSRNYTITNKFFQYIEAGLPVIASQTAGQTEMFDQFKPGILLPQQPAENDIKMLTEWLGDNEKLQQARQQALEAANFYSWEKESEKIIDLIKKSLETAS